ncbi:hypothetical protein OE903_18630 [Bacillus sp. B6(2022)]|nr:hypothetical protein [Bacillus sp. B6(2022)]
MRGVYVPHAGSDYRGFPIDWLVLHSNYGVEFLFLGFILDVIIFYFLLKVLLRVYKRIMTKSAE